MEGISLIVFNDETKNILDARAKENAEVFANGGCVSTLVLSYTEGLRASYNTDLSRYCLVLVYLQRLDDTTTIVGTLHSVFFRPGHEACDYYLQRLAYHLSEAGLTLLKSLNLA